MRLPTYIRRLADPRDLLPILADRSELDVQMAAVIYTKNGIIAWGWNSHWTHAEEMAFSRTPRKMLKDATLTVYGRRKKSGNMVLSKPCTRRGCWDMAVSSVAVVEWYDPTLGLIAFKTKEGTKCSTPLSPLSRRKTRK